MANDSLKHMLALALEAIRVAEKYLRHAGEQLDHTGVDRAGEEPPATPRSPSRDIPKENS